MSEICQDSDRSLECQVLHTDFDEPNIWKVQNWAIISNDLEYYVLLENRCNRQNTMEAGAEHKFWHIEEELDTFHVQSNNNSDEQAKFPQEQSGFSNLSSSISVSLASTTLYDKFQANLTPERACWMIKAIEHEAPRGKLLTICKLFKMSNLSKYSLIF